jgi:hypothetical protein
MSVFLFSNDLCGFELFSDVFLHLGHFLKSLGCHMRLDFQAETDYKTIVPVLLLVPPE